MKKRFFGVLMLLMFPLCIMPASDGCSQDYTTFSVMQRIADAHFDAAEYLNEQFQLEHLSESNRIRPATYWLMDSRKSEPTILEEIVPEQGLLFNPKTSTLISKFGVWCFSGEKMYKHAQGGNVHQMSPGEPWQKFRDEFATLYHLETERLTGSADLLIVQSYYGTRLPKLVLCESLYKPEACTLIDDSSPEGSFSSSSSSPNKYERSVAFIKNCVSPLIHYLPRHKKQEPVIEEHEMHDLPPVEDVLAYASQGFYAFLASSAERHELILKIWRQMKERYETEKNNL